MALFRKTKKVSQSEVPKVEETVSSPTESRPISRSVPSEVATKVFARPKISEKATKLLDQRKYVFLVNEKSTKPEIKRAIEGTYRVHVEALNTIRIKGKTKAWRRRIHKAPAIKKAVVTLREGDKIEIT